MVGEESDLREKTHLLDGTKTERQREDSRLRDLTEVVNLRSSSLAQPFPFIAAGMPS